MGTVLETTKQYLQFIARYLQPFISPERHIPGRRIALLTAILLFAAFLRIRNLDANGLWVDEIFTALLAGPDNSVPQVIRNAVTTPLPQAPLWYLVSYVMFLLIGVSDFAVRLPAVYVGLLGLAMIYRVGTRYLGSHNGLIGALLLGFSPLHLYLSREGRFYASLVLLSLCSIYFLLQALEYNKPRDWVFYSIITVAAVYVHLTGFFLVVSEGVFVLVIAVLNWLKAEKTSFIDWIRQSILVPFSLCTVAIALAYLPMILVLIPGLGGERGLGSTEGTDGFAVSLPFILGMLVSFGPGTKLPGGLFIVTAVWGGGMLFKRKLRLLIMFVIMFSLPIVVIWIARPKHWFAYKYVIHLLPLYLLLVASGISQLASLIEVMLDDLRGRWKRLITPYTAAILTVLFAALGTLSFADAYSQRSDHWRDVGVLLSENAKDNDAIAALPVNLLTMPAEEIMTYYLQSDRAPAPQAVVTVSELTRLHDTHRRVWLVVGPGYNREQGIEVIRWAQRQPNVEIILEGGARIIYFGKGKSTEDLLSEAEQFASSEARFFSSLASEFRKLDEWDKSLAFYRTASVLDPHAGFHHLNQAIILERFGSDDLAEGEYIAATLAEPDVAGFHIVLARFYERNAQTLDAILSYQRAMRIWRSQVGIDNAYYAEWEQIVEQLEASVVDEHD